MVPNTVSIAKEEACEARVITEATHPYRITYASQSWCDLFGYEPAKVIGQTCKILQGEETEMDRIEEIMTGVKFGRAGSTVLTNYNSDGEKMTISLRTYPLYTEVALTHYLGKNYYSHSMPVSEISSAGLSRTELQTVCVVIEHLYATVSSPPSYLLPLLNLQMHSHLRIPFLISFSFTPLIHPS